MYDVVALSYLLSFPQHNFRGDFDRFILHAKEATQILSNCCFLEIAMSKRKQMYDVYNSVNFVQNNFRNDIDRYIMHAKEATQTLSNCCFLKIAMSMLKHMYEVYLKYAYNFA